MDRYAAMQCFCRIVETGSFAAAARDLDLSRSVVTKYVQQLEEWTASRLLSRTTRAVRPTPAGHRFHDYCRRVLADTEATLADLRDDAQGPSGRLVVAAPVSLTLAYLGAHFCRFRSAWPGIALDVRLSDQPVDLVREGVDVALRGQATLPDSSHVARPLMRLERVVCAAPSYWARHGRPVHPAELQSHELLPYLLGSDAHEWTLSGPDGRHRVPVRGGWRADNSLLLVQALVAGQGVGLLPRVMVRHELADGRLQAVLPDHKAEPRRLFAVMPTRQHLPARVRVFIDHLQAAIRADGWAADGR